MGKSKSQAASRGAAAYRKIMEKDEGSSRDAGSSDSKEAAVPKAMAVPSGKGRKNFSGGGLVKTGRPRPQVPPEKAPLKETPPDSKYRRAARFLVLIGSDEASKIISRLESDQIEAISKEIVTIGSISPEEAEAVLEEFRGLLSPAYGYSGSSSGGVEEARRLLYAAFGPEKGEQLLVKAVPAAAENPFDFLTEFSGEQLALLFKNESPAASAMVFSRLPPKLSAAALANVNPGKKLEIVRRIARLNESPPEVIERAAAALREKARHFGRDDSAREIDGKGVLAAILKHSDTDFGGRILEELGENDPFLSREMKDRLYSLEDVVNAADRPIQEKLKTMDDREIALLLKGRSEAFTQKILGNISVSRAGRIRDESAIMGPVPKIETEAAAREFLAWFRLNREEGRILMLSGEDVLV